eukprot:9228274-Alexandrium_andersonii.AAC.1
MKSVVVLLLKARLHGWLWTSWTTSSLTPRFRRYPLRPTGGLARHFKRPELHVWRERARRSLRRLRPRLHGWRWLLRALVPAAVANRAHVRS